ncbi:hypothetical protein [Haloferula sp. BvORR071]|uniref:hypothetical protein n=1 Tax=Haloferula sp. BvORR071 TaxID=1396141 RepID=UPI00054FE3A6|nr:hypothetical protein [Haloferula sp. BvORR071]
MKMALLLSYLLSAAAALAGNLGFSQMDDGDRIEISEHSTGCFHDSTSYYEVTKANGSHLFREFAITWSKASPSKILEKKLIGETKLSATEIAGLDRLLGFYRGAKDVSSTTQVSLLVEYFEPDKLVKVERLSDSSGGYGLEERKDIVTLFALAQRAKKQAVEQGVSVDPAKPGD